MYYAKSRPKETLEEHTLKLIENYELLKKSYGNKLKNKKVLKLLLLAAKYHDLGKSATSFQNMIRKELDLPLLNTSLNYKTPHNFLSPAFLPSYKKLNISKKDMLILIQAIGFHHERSQGINIKDITKVIKEDLNLKIKHIQEELEELDIEIPNEIGNKHLIKLDNKHRIKSKDDIYLDYILVKGLLHKLDYSASANEKIELGVEEHIGEYTRNYMKSFPELREVQKFSQVNKDNNLIITASTGIGKTESALLWIDKYKGFFTLPLRVSINALYNRVKDEIGYESVGLLHSTSIDFLESTEEKNSEDIYNQSRLLSKKLIFCTIDQILKIPFKYKGYEKNYAVLAYSKVVVDEIQSYDPRIVAVLLTALKMIRKIGGKFMIITATLPPIYKEYLRKEIGKELVEGIFLSDNNLPYKQRHKIKINDKYLLEDEDLILNRAKEKKVLIIVNTVKKAIETFENLSKNDLNVKVNLLHSKFIQKHRGALEKKIKAFADTDGEKGIWITTQLVEASLDIDFDYLFTNLPSLDSLFQRMGRCYRKRQFNLSEANCNIYIKGVTGIGSVYDKDIWHEGLNLIKEYDGFLLTEEDKTEMIEKLYSRDNLEGTDFLNVFDDSIKYLETIEEYDVSNRKAQQLLRRIDNVVAIPLRIYEEVEEKIMDYLNYNLDTNDTTSVSKFRKLKREINSYTLNVSSYKRKVSIGDKFNSNRLDDVYIINSDYDFEKSEVKGRGLIS